MRELERRREGTVDHLARAYARGQLATDSLEHRLEVALAAAHPEALAATLWGLPAPGVPRWSQLRLDGHVLAASADRTVWVLGRSRSCDVRLLDPEVSGQHARLACRGGRWSVVDLGSTNGTWVNGERIAYRLLEPDDELVLGALRGRLGS